MRRALSIDNPCPIQHDAFTAPTCRGGCRRALAPSGAISTIIPSACLPDGRFNFWAIGPEKTRVDLTTRHEPKLGPPWIRHPEERLATHTLHRHVLEGIPPPGSARVATVRIRPKRAPAIVLSDPSTDKVVRRMIDPPLTPIGPVGANHSWRLAFWSSCDRVVRLDVKRSDCPGCSSVWLER